MTLSVEDKVHLITTNLQEVIRGDLIEEVLKTRDLKIYWGTATTGRPHAGYIVPALKIAQFLQAGCHIKVLLADIHALLDADKAPEAVLEKRAQYYERTIRALLQSVGVDIGKLEFVRGSSYQLSPKYMFDLLRLSKKVSMHEATRASAEVVKQMGEPAMADGLYPMMQLLDEEYLDVDAEFGGVDQRKIFALSHDAMGKLGFKPRSHLMNAMIPGLQGAKMSSSDPKSKIDLVDDAANIRKKVSKAVCAPREVEGNGVLSFIQHVLFPYHHLQAIQRDGSAAIRQSGSVDIVVREGEGERTVSFASFDELADAYRQDVVTPQIAKKLVEEMLLKLTESIRAAFEADAEWQKISEEAYPDPAAAEAAAKKAAKEKKKEKKAKGKEFQKQQAANEGDAGEPKGSVVVPIVE